MVDTLIHPNLFSTFFFFSHVGIPISSIKVVIGQKEHPIFSLPAQICIAFLVSTSFETFPCVKKHLVDLLGSLSYVDLVDCKDEKTPSKKTRTPNGTFLKHVFLARPKIQDWDKANRNLQRGNQHMHLWHLGFFCDFCGDGGWFWDLLVGPFFLHFLGCWHSNNPAWDLACPVTARNAGKYPAELLRSPKNCLGYACLCKNSTAFFRFMFPQHLQTGIGQ